MFDDFMNMIDEESMAGLTLEGDTAIETELFLTALRSECSEEEYNALVQEAAVEMELYGLIDSAQIATEAQKNIVKMNKAAVFNKIEKRAAIRLAEKAKDNLYTKYAKGRKLMVEARIAIYDKYGSKAKSEAKKIIANARRKASSIKSGSGKSIVDKMDKQIEKVNKNQK